MTSRKRPRSRKPPSDAVRTRTRRVVAVMVATAAVLSACLVALWLLRPKAGPGTHEHLPAAHGGVVVPLGEGDRHLHAEAVLDRGGLLMLYTLGDDAEKVEEVGSQILTAVVRTSGSQESVPVALLPYPQDGDSEARTSRFAGKLPDSLLGKPLTVAVSDIAVGEGRFPLVFTLEAEGEEASIRAIEAEKLLYRTPGGKYTEADIRANGDATAARKFAGFHATHDFHSRPGDVVCPVTRAKADPSCTWIVGGQTYTFCCPPCVDQFLKTAKQRPGQVKEPADYVKKQ